MSATKGSLEEAASLLESFGVGPALTSKIAALEAGAVQLSREELEALLRGQEVDADLLGAAREVKRIAGQINVVIHAVGILVSLPYVLEQGERIESLSLGAGNTGRDHDLTTDRRIAEFKFIDWRGGSETIRQNNIFADVFNLAITRSPKRKVLYILGTDHPLKFLTGGRAMTSILGRTPKVRQLFLEAYGEDSYETVGQYWEEIRDKVVLVDLRELVPAFKEG